MKTVTIVGWSACFQKVGLTNFLRHNIGYTLSEAKAATDSVLANQQIDLQVQETDFEQITSTLRDLGTILAPESRK